MLLKYNFLVKYNMKFVSVCVCVCVNFVINVKKNFIIYNNIFYLYVFENINVDT